MSILKSAKRMMNMMEESPHEFILNHQEKDLKKFKGFVHRTFNEQDLIYFISSLKNIYTKHGGLEKQFSTGEIDLQKRIHQFKKIFLNSITGKNKKTHFRSAQRVSGQKNKHVFAMDGEVK